MRKVIMIFVLIHGVLSSCGPETRSELSQEDSTGGLAEGPSLEGEVPSKGRSLFDQVTMEESGGQRQQVIPYPFSALRDLLESHLEKPMTATLIPRGRSLQRHATTEPFRFPRVVLAATSDSQSRPGSLGFQLKDRLYVGYVESSQQMEVISFNPDLGRFEFQLIENYGPGLTPRVRYANRDFCLACHQNKAPIFANPSWDETAANPRIQDQLIATIQQDRYLDVPIRQLRNIPNAIDDSTDRANLLSPLQTLWHKACDTGTDVSTWECRKQSLMMALTYRIYGEFSREDYELLKKAYEQGWRKHLPQGLSILDNNIPNFNPLLSVKGGTHPELLASLGVEVKESLSRLATDADLPLSAEPLQPRPTPLMTWTLAGDDAGRLIFGLADELTPADERWVKSLAPDPAAIRLLIARVPFEEDGPFSQSTFVSCEILGALAKSAGQPLPSCEERHFAAMPPPVATGQEGLSPAVAPPSTASMTMDPRLALVKSYCGGCHAAGPLNFLEGDDSQIMARLRREGATHAHRLDWEASPSGSMPPPRSAARTRLEKSAADRQSIKDFFGDLGHH